MKTFYVRNGKRLFDILASALMIVLLCIPGVIASLVIRLLHGEKAFVRQTRVGANKELYKMARLRLSGSALSGFLKEKGLDKLPALLNVFAGDMSLVGPVPALPNDYTLLKHRDDCGAEALRPGLLQASEDAAYVNGIGFVTDMRRIFGGGKNA